MCELFALSSHDPATVTLSLEVFAKRGGLTGPHKDGWGIAYYEDGGVLLIRDSGQASTSPWVTFVENQAPASRTVISHIRRATQGAVKLRNTHPFSRELGGTSHVFAHNGGLKGLDRFYDPARARFHPIGDTDSELAFCILMERMSEIWLAGTTPPTRDDRLGIFNDFAADMVELGAANFLYADGECLFAHGHRRKQDDGETRPPGLYMLAQACPAEGASIATDGITVTGKDQQVVLFASVPLADEPWTPLEQGHVVMVADGEECGIDRS